MHAYLMRGLCVSIFVASCLVLDACGGGGGGGNGGNGSGGNGSNGGGAANTTVLTGILLDAPTQGVNYSASGYGTPQSGVTGSDGGFNFVNGQTVTFSLAAGSGGSIALGAASVAAPAHNANGYVFVGTLPNGLQIARVLQSLNHSTLTSVINVGALTLSPVDVTNLAAFISSGGATVPVNGFSAMITAAQNTALATSPSLVFAAPGGVSDQMATAALMAGATGANVQTIIVTIDATWMNALGLSCDACNFGAVVSALDPSGNQLAVSNLEIDNPVNGQSGQGKSHLVRKVAVSYAGTLAASYSVVIPPNQQTSSVCSVTSGGSGSVVANAAGGAASATTYVTCNN